MPDAAELYERDFFLWTQEQGKRLREAAQHGLGLPLDWENLAEEIESLGRTDRRKLREHLTTIIEQLLGLEHSAASSLREQWREGVQRTRRDAELLLKDSPSLRSDLPALVQIAFNTFARYTV